MSKVIVGMTMSLDGYVNDKQGNVGRLYADFDALRKTALFQESIRTTGAVVMGKQAYEMAQGDFTGYEYQVPLFVLTHHSPQTVAKGENDRLRFVFVTDGIESAVRQAIAAAGDKDVTVVGGASTVQQIISAGLADELHVDIMPVLLGGGLRLFEFVDVELERLAAREITTSRTHLAFRIISQEMQM